MLVGSKWKQCQTSGFCFEGEEYVSLSLPSSYKPVLYTSIPNTLGPFSNKQYFLSRLLMVWYMIELVEAIAVRLHHGYCKLIYILTNTLGCNTPLETFLFKIYLFLSKFLFLKIQSCFHSPFHLPFFSFPFSELLPDMRKDLFGHEATGLTILHARVTLLALAFDVHYKKCTTGSGALA